MEGKEIHNLFESCLSLISKDKIQALGVIGDQYRLVCGQKVSIHDLPST